MSDIFARIIKFIKALYPAENPVPLHAPRFTGNEKKYLIDCIDTTYVSYVGEYVGRFEDAMRQFTGAKYAVAVSSGTAALHVALLLAEVAPGDEVITQPLTFVATANAISYCSAQPIFVDVERSTLGLDPEILNDFLLNNGILKSDGRCYNKITGKKIAACVPMHTLGHPVRIDQIIEICQRYHIPVVEDAAEALGSFYQGQHGGTFGELGILSFNGNKPVTTGGGGMIITNDETLAANAKHLTTTAKKPHPWEFFHDEVGYNYRMPNINAAVGCAQMECFTGVLENKRATAQMYNQFFQEIGIPFITEPANARSNYWLNTIVLKDRQERDEFLGYATAKGIQARPVWTLMTYLPMYRACQSASIETAQWLEDRLVNIPSSMRVGR
ncbi:MAG: aminotransferase DegT [Deltaproteobacteria bacterium CG_4_8_14_3_um_filter_43_13]|nr:MAG: aminotransferase DegT [Alphaproteobacteria bacterium CG1_02_46_17]OIP30571.1 MAG: aminotransferase DegT [Deltaproteobacteria bacterium CG2_30_43_15]PIU85201.1 MAG: aminotransferase DegT [Deltaproteobacteria bacterium CG06_land_8_20_14_3_00_44_19]PIX24862.1 MAG: aminotransferase DegT [Deltaproteobacteria bacterium CG_4_8_14_3_um_filter_43_13]HCX90135.1 LegC family aminotransferase [Deltaproteobacteria bacterium]